MGLREYRRKRKFDVTSEPRGAAPAASTAIRRYVIQKHAATRLHYDFRLELDGVLKSWAVPKGPSLDPDQKSLAIQVEDHPLEYGSFEGTIPKGQYGGGTVMLWDQGTWEAIGDAKKDYRHGRLKFVLHGEKLQGVWNLVRMAPRAGAKKSEWLLIKHRDEHAKSQSDYDILARKSRSVTSGRTMDQIAKGNSEVWESDRPKRRKTRTARMSESAAKPSDPSTLPGARKARQPDFIAPQLATLVNKAPEGDEWIHEVKLDGYRVIAVLRNGRAHLFTRKANDWTGRFEVISQAVERLPVSNAIIDGEVTVLGKNGITDFQALQAALKDGQGNSLVYFVFDIVHCEGFNLTSVPLLERRRWLRDMMALRPDPHLRFSDHVQGQGPKVLQAACRMKLEGIVSKRADAPYESARGASWVKSKCKGGQEFVIGGFTEPAGARQGFGALLVGYYDGDGKLHYAGRVGTGFTNASLNQLKKRLDAMLVTQSPFHDGPKGRSYRWVRPELVAQVEFTHFTRDRRIRHPSFKGLREDKPATSIRLEAKKEVPDGEAPLSARTLRSGSKHMRRKTPTRNKTAEGQDQVAGVRLTHPERMLFSDVELTKLDVARYLELASDRVLPQVAHRPMMILRCPEGAGGPCFHQKHVNETLPSALRGVRIQEKEKQGEHLVLDSIQGLIGLAQMSALEIHTWGCREDKIEAPDRIIFDLDPAPDVEWNRVVDTGKKLREVLRKLDLASFVKLSGGKGLHIVVPIERRHGWDRVESFARSVADAFVTAHPSEYIATMSKAKRQGKIYIDYLRNQRGATCVAAYSPRARPGAPVSMPVTWKALSNIAAGNAFNIKNILARGLDRIDPWADYGTTKQRLPRSP